MKRIAFVFAALLVVAFAADNADPEWDYAEAGDDWGSLVYTNGKVN